LERAEEGYNVILPAEPFIFGVRHNMPVVSQPRQLQKFLYKKAGKSNLLEGDAQLKAREAALLAKKLESLQVMVRR
jgi:hypothetical protein